MNKEHLFPMWLVLRTGTHKTGIRWGSRRGVSARRATLPLCEECNAVFGRELEGPTRKLFDDIENMEGLSDNDAELLIRWMWKIKGLAWLASAPNGKYTEAFTLRERVLRPIDQVRGHLVLAIALLKDLHPESRDYPMGMNSYTECDAIFVSGVFSRVAAMAVLEDFADLIPEQFTQFHLHPKRVPSGDAKLLHPSETFRDDVEAVGITWEASRELARLHDEFARECLRLEQ